MPTSENKPEPDSTSNKPEAVSSKDLSSEALKSTETPTTQEQIPSRLSKDSQITHRTFLQGLFGTYASIFKDKGVILMLIIAPIIYGFFYPWPYRGEVVNEVPVGIVDQDHSKLSQTIARYSDVSPNLTVQIYASQQDAIEAMYHNDIAGYLIIPKNLESDVYANKPTHVTILGNNSYFLLNKQVQLGFAKAIGTISAGVEIKRSVAKGTYIETAKVSTQAIPLRIDPMFNRSEGYGAYVVPAVAILILQQTLLLSTALLIGTWYENKRQNASASGWLGRILALSSISFLVACFYYGWVFTAQNYPRGHNMLGTLFFMAIFSPVVATVGCLLGMWFKERERSMQILIFSSLPMFFLSGYPWPVSQLPIPLQYVRWLFPTTSGMNASVQLNQMGASLSQVSGYLYHLVALGTVTYILLLWAQRRQIKHASKR